MLALHDASDALAEQSRVRLQCKYGFHKFQTSVIPSASRSGQLFLWARTPFVGDILLMCILIQFLLRGAFLNGKKAQLTTVALSKSAYVPRTQHQRNCGASHEIIFSA